MKDKRKVIIVLIFIVILLVLSISLILNKTKANSYQYDGNIITDIEMDNVNNKIKVNSSETNLSYKIVEFGNNDADLKSIINNIESRKQVIKEGISKNGINMYECPLFSYREYYIEDYQQLKENINKSVFGIPEKLDINENYLYDLGYINQLKTYYDVCNEEINYVNFAISHETTNYVESYIEDVLDKNIDYLTSLNESISNSMSPARKIVLLYDYKQRYLNKELQTLVKNTDKFNEFYKSKIYTNSCIESDQTSEGLCSVSGNSIVINQKSEIEDLINELTKKKEKISESIISIDNYNGFYREFESFYKMVSNQYEYVSKASIELLSKLGIITTSDFQSITNSEIPYDFNNSEKRILLVKTVKNGVEYFDYEIIGKSQIAPIEDVMQQGKIEISLDRENNKIKIGNSNNYNIDYNIIDINRDNITNIESNISAINQKKEQIENYDKKLKENQKNIIDLCNGLITENDIIDENSKNSCINKFYNKDEIQNQINAASENLSKWSGLYNTSLCVIKVSEGNYELSQGQSSLCVDKSEIKPYYDAAENNFNELRNSHVNAITQASNIDYYFGLYNDALKNINSTTNEIKTIINNINNIISVTSIKDWKAITNNEISYDFSKQEKDQIILVKSIVGIVDYYDFEIIKNMNSSTGDSNKPSTGDDNKPSTGDSNKPSTGDSNKPSTGDSNKPSTGDSNKPSTGDSNKPSTGDDNKPSTGDDNKPSTGDDNKPSTGDSNKPSTGDDIINPQTGDINIPLIIGGIIVSLVVLTISIVYIIKHRKNKEI